MTGLKQSLRGFTLIELLISLTIMMMIFTLGFQGYRLYSQSWQKDLSKFNSSFQRYKTEDLFTSAIYGIIPYMVQSVDKQAFYFLGREEGFTAVTVSPMFSPEASAVIRVFKEQLPDGKFQLVYEEASLRDLVLVSPEQELPFKHRRIVMTGLPSVEFAYFGLKNKQALFEDADSSEGSQTIRQWFPVYDGLQTELHPSRLRIKLDNLELNIDVPSRFDLGYVTPEVVL